MSICTLELFHGKGRGSEDWTNPQVGSVRMLRVTAFSLQRLQGVDGAASEAIGLWCLAKSFNGMSKVVCSSYNLPTLCLAGREEDEFLSSKFTLLWIALLYTPWLVPQRPVPPIHSPCRYVNDNVNNLQTLTSPILQQRFLCTN